MRSSTAAAVAALIMLVSATTASRGDARTRLVARLEQRRWSGALRQRASVPLKAATPAWFTDELAARVDAANGAPVAAPNDAPLPGEVGIPPGRG